MKHFIISIFLAFLLSIQASAQMVGAAAALPGAGQSVGPSLVFYDDFTSSVDGRFSFTRSSTGWDFNSSGVLTSFSTNVPMQPVYPGAGTTNGGIGLWPQRTNSCLHSQTPATQSVSMSSGTWAISVGPKDTGSITVSGTGLTFGGTGSAVATSSYTVNVAVASTTTATMTVSGTLSYIGCEKATATVGATNVTASPEIVTTGSVGASRSFDLMSVPLSNIAIPKNAGTFYLRFIIPAYGSSSQYILYANDGTNNNGFSLNLATSQRLTLNLLVGGTIAASTSITASLSVGTLHTVAITYDPYHFAISLDGATTKTVVFGNGLTLTTLNLGSNVSGTQNISGYIQNLGALNGSVNSALLQALSQDPIPVPPGGFDIWFIMGQSNGYGSYAVPVLTTLPPYASQAYMLNDVPNIHGCGQTKCSTIGGVISGVQPAFESAVPIPPCSVSLQNCGESPGTSMMAESIFKGSTQALVVRNASAPGNTIASIAKPSQAYTNATTALSQFNALVVSAGGTLKSSVLAFNHGQTDQLSGTDPTTYCTGVSTLQSNWATDAITITGQAGGHLPMALIIVPPDGGGMANYLAQCQWSLAAATPANFLVAGPSYQIPLGHTHGPHFSNAGQRLQGEMLGKCAYNYINGGATCPYFAPVSATFQSGDHSKINVTFNIPTNPAIRNFTTPQGAAPFDGFFFVDDTRSAQMVSYSITGTTSSTVTMQFQLSAVSSGGNPTLSYAMYGEVGVNSAQAAQATKNLAISISNPGTGGTNGTCNVTTSLDPTHTLAQAVYAVTISGGGITAFASANPVQNYGQFSASAMGQNWNNVPVTGCGLSGATLSGINIAYQMPAIINDVKLPTIANWDGISSGPCTITTNIDSSGAYQQAQLAVTVTGGTPAITGVTQYGAWPLSDVTPPSYIKVYNNVAFTGCGVTSAVLNSVQLTQGIQSDLGAGTWGNLSDSDVTVGVWGDTLSNWLVPFSIPVN